MSMVNGAGGRGFDGAKFADLHLQLAAMLLEQEAQQSAAEREHRHAARVQSRAALADEVQAIRDEARTLIAGAAVSSALTVGGGAAKLTAGAHRVDASDCRAQSKGVKADQIAARAEIWSARGDAACGLAQPSLQLSEGFQRQHQADATAARGAREYADTAQADAQDMQGKLTKFADGVLQTLEAILVSVGETTKYVVRG
jgi:hypothetical protein